MMERAIREHKAIRSYLDEVCGQIRAKEMHEDIRMELACHLEELAYEKLDRIGEDEGGASTGEPTDAALEEAVEHAIRQMGGPRTVGRQLHRVHKPKTEWSLVALVAALIGIGLMAMYALQQVGDPDSLISWLPLLSNKLRFVGIGAALLIAMYFADYRKLRLLIWPIYSVAAGLFILARSMGLSINGAYNWLVIGGIALDVSSLAPYLFLIAYAGYLASEKPMPSSLAGKTLAYGKELGLFYAIPAFLYMAAPALVPLAVHFAGASILLLTRKQGWRRLLFHIVAFLSTFAFAIFALRGFRYDGIRGSFMYQRWMNYLHTLVGDDYLTLPSKEFIRSAGLWGHGFEAGAERLHYAYSENIVAYLVGSLGWAFGIGLAMLVAAFIYRSVRIAGQSKDPFARLLVIAISSVLAVKLVWTILMSVGLLPFVGMTMPFIGYSGLQTVIEMASIGLLLSVFRRKDIVSLPRRRMTEEAAR